VGVPAQHAGESRALFSQRDKIVKEDRAMSENDIDRGLLQIEMREIRIASQIIVQTVNPDLLSPDGDLFILIDQQFDIVSSENLFVALDFNTAPILPIAHDGVPGAVGCQPAKILLQKGKRILRFNRITGNHQQIRINPVDLLDRLVIDRFLPRDVQVGNLYHAEFPDSGLGKVYRIHDRVLAPRQNEDAENQEPPDITHQPFISLTYS